MQRNTEFGLFKKPSYFLILNTLEVLMLNVTETAQQQIADFFKDKEEVKPIRLFLNQGG